MKKTDLFRNLVAVLFLAAGAASCSNENALIDDNKPQQPEAKTQIITVIVREAKKGKYLQLLKIYQKEKNFLNLIFLLK